jgi:heme oxygenase
LARIAGCLYVVEGSTLGGMHLSRSGRGFPKGAVRFYQGYGEQTVPAWKTFIGWLDGSVDASAEARAAEAAIEVFDWFQRTFTLLAHDPETAPRREG